MFPSHQVKRLLPAISSYFGRRDGIAGRISRRLSPLCKLSDMIVFGKPQFDGEADDFDSGIFRYGFVVGGMDGATLCRWRI